MNYRRLSLLVGGFVALSLGLLVASILLLSSERGIFTERYRVVARFDNVQGLLGGAPVWLAGKEVGRVETVRFDRLGVTPPIIVVLKIDADVRDRVRAVAAPYPGAFTALGRARLVVWKAAAQGGDDGAPGTVLAVTADGVHVQCGRGTLIVGKFKFEGVPPLPELTPGVVLGRGGENDG